MSAGAPGLVPSWGRALIATGCHLLTQNDTNDRILWSLVGDKTVIPISSEAAYKPDAEKGKLSDAFDRVTR